MKKETISTISQFVFIVLMFVVVIFVSLGISLDFARIKTAQYWIEVSIQVVMTMTTFNMVYYLDRNNKMHDKASRFFMAYMTNRLKISSLENNRMFDELDNAVELENKERLIAKVNSLLHKICTRILYEDVMENLTPDAEEPTYLSVEELAKKHRVSEKRLKKFYKLVNKIRAGEIRVKPIKSASFLKDKELIKIDFETYDYSESLFDLQRNGTKLLTFVICGLIMASIGFSFVSPDFLRALFTNLTVIAGACVSGFMSSKKSIKMKTRLYESRNSFLKRRLSIDDEWQEKIE